MLIGILLLTIVGALAIVPQYWVQSVLRKHAQARPDLAFTGGAFARHALDGMKLGHVTVERTRDGDHYDPVTRSVRLSADNFDRRSLTAIVVAAHEVGHAMQDATGYGPLRERTATAIRAAQIQRLGSIVMLVAPLLMIVLKSPVLVAFEMITGALLMLSAALMHVRTLPVEFDASFKRALPLLEQGQFIDRRDLTSAQAILRAAAFTYVASALMTLLDLSRWLRVLRF